MSCCERLKELNGYSLSKRQKELRIQVVEAKRKQSILQWASEKGTAKKIHWLQGEPL